MKKQAVFLSGFLLLATFSLAACLGGPGASQGVVQRAEQKSGFMGLQKSDDVKVTGAAAFKETKRVVVGGFSIGFATYKTDSAKAGGGLMGNGFGGKSTARSTLTGVDAATMQSITDKAYAQFVADLKKNGYEVVDRQSLLADPDFAKSTTLESPHEDSSGGLFGAKSKTVYFAPSSFGGLKPFLGDIAGETGGFGKSNPTTAASVFAQKGDVKVVNVVYVLDFANADSYGGSWRSSSAVSVGQGVTIVPDYSKLGINGGYGGTFASTQGSLQIGQPITSAQEFATVEDSTTGADKASQTAANVIGLIGGIGTNASRNYTFAARKADYAKAASEALSEAGGKMVAQMKSLQ